MPVHEETHKTFKIVQHHSAWCMHSHSAAFHLTVLLGLCLSPTNMQRDTTGLDGELSQITDLHQSSQVGPASCVACLMEKHCTGGGGQAETCQLQYLPNVQACTSTAQGVVGKLQCLPNVLACTSPAQVVVGKLDAPESLRQEDLDDLLRYGARELFAEQAAEASGNADGAPWAETCCGNQE